MLQADYLTKSLPKPELIKRLKVRRNPEDCCGVIGKGRLLACGIANCSRACPPGATTDVAHALRALDLECAPILGNPAHLCLCSFSTQHSFPPLSIPPRKIHPRLGRSEQRTRARHACCCPLQLVHAHLCRCQGFLGRDRPSVVGRDSPLGDAVFRSTTGPFLVLCSPPASQVATGRLESYEDDDEAVDDTLINDSHITMRQNFIR